MRVCVVYEVSPFPLTLLSTIKTNKQRDLARMTGWSPLDRNSLLQIIKDDGRMGAARERGKDRRYTKKDGKSV